MTRDRLIVMHEQMAALIARRRHLGAFDANAETIISIAEVLFDVIEHQIDVIDNIHDSWRDTSEAWRRDSGGGEHEDQG